MAQYRRWTWCGSASIASAPLRAAEARYRVRWKEVLHAWELRQQAKKGKGKAKDSIGPVDDDPKPPEPKMVTSDTTIEALADAMVEKFAGDSIREMRRNYESYVKYLGERGGAL